MRRIKRACVFQFVNAQVVARAATPRREQMNILRSPWARRAWSARSRRAAEDARFRDRGSRLAAASVQPQAFGSASAER